MEIGTFHCFLGNPCRLSFNGTCIYRHMKTKKTEVRFNIKKIFLIENANFYFIASLLTAK